MLDDLDNRELQDQSKTSLLEASAAVGTSSQPVRDYLKNNVAFLTQLEI